MRTPIATTARSAAFLLFFWGSVVVYGSAMLLTGWIARSWLTRLARAWTGAVLWGLCRLCGIRARVHGRENLPDGPAVVLSKHQSTWETIALARLLPQPQTWVLKRELLRIPFFGWAMALFRPIAIDRAAGRQAVRQLLETGLERLAEGSWIVVFPEGTRMPVGETRRFAHSGAALAVRAGAPVVPIAHNAGVFWPRRGLAKHPGVIDLVIGPAIPTRDASAAEVSAQAEAWINETVEGLPGDTRAAAAGPFGVQHPG